MIGFVSGSGWYDSTQDLHRFEAVNGTNRVRCVISQIALAKLAHDKTEIRPSELFDKIEHRVFDLASLKYRTTGLNAHGILAINSGDLRLLPGRTTLVTPE